MEVEQQLEWDELGAMVVSSLRQYKYIDVVKHCPKVQFLLFPLFGDVVSVDVVETSGRYGAFITTWRQMVDIQAFETGTERRKHPFPFVPTVCSKRIGVPTRQVKSLIDQMAFVQIGLCSVRNSCLLDGTVYELYSGTRSGGVRLQWHDDLPADWSALGAIVDGFREMLTLADV